MALDQLAGVRIAHQGVGEGLIELEQSTVLEVVDPDGEGAPTALNGEQRDRNAPGVEQPAVAALDEVTERAGDEPESSAIRGSDW